MSQRMDISQALGVLAELRTDEIVLTTMGTAREWPVVSQSPLDFHYIPSAMGHLAEIALGLALAQPDRDVIALNGDGSQLMSLGGLVTIAMARPENLTLLVANNGVFEVTGGQRTADDGTVDFAAIARGAGFPSASSFSDLETWRERVSETLAAPGPRFVELKVAPVRDDYVLEVPKNDPLPDRVARFRAAVMGTDAE